jgi:peptidoglycan/LPS O-acetylase OafA/YrhL
MRTKISRQSMPIVRLHSLDGLRGAAAVVVLIHHALLMVPELAANYYGENSGRDYGTLTWWATYTPLHLLWEGTAAVYVFFILSGMVLSLPVIGSSKFSWRAYFPQRILRLYLPVWGAVAFAILTIFIFPRVAEMPSEWLNARTREVTLAAVVKDATLIFGAGGLASPLWSLRWEILFSLLLPVFIWVGRRAAKYPIPSLILCLVLISLGGLLDRDALRYIPMFMIGVLLANARAHIVALGGRIDSSRYSTVLWVAFSTSAALLLGTHWITSMFGLSGSLQESTIGLTVAGAVQVVLIAAYCHPVSRVLQMQLFQTLGTISFSLYLIHEPIVIAVGFTLGPSNPIAVVLSILVSLLLARLFYLAVERPCHRTAKWVHSRISSRETQKRRPELEPTSAK